MNETDFETLHELLGRFDNIHPRWSSILVLLISRCDGFVETITLNNETTNNYLLDNTVKLLETLPKSATDTDIANLIAEEFDGWYMTALTEDGGWDITQQTFRQWVQDKHVSEALISSAPYTSAQQARLYINRLLGGAC